MCNLIIISTDQSWVFNMRKTNFGMQVPQFRPEYSANRSILFFPELSYYAGVHVIFHNSIKQYILVNI